MGHLWKRNVEMKRLTLLLALVLLPSQALAECAWVLWSRISRTVAIPKGLPGEGALRKFRRWSVVKAEETKGDCEGTAKFVLYSRYGTEAGRAAIDDGRLELGPMWAKEVMPDGSVESLMFYCLPDTVDPRGKEER